MATASPTTVIVHPTTNYPGEPSDSTGTTTSSTTMFGNTTMSSTVSTTHVQHNTTTSSTSTATNRPTTVTTNIPTTTLAPTTQNSVRTTSSAYRTSNNPPHLISYVAVECIPGYVTVVIKRDVLHNHYIQESSLYLGKPECGLSGGNASHVWLTTSWAKCGTKLANVSSVRLEVPVICSFPRGILISTGYAPSGYFDMINDPVAGSGSFQVTVRLLNGTIPLPENFTLSPDDEIIVEVGVNTTISQIKVVIDKCWATSSSDSSEKKITTLFNNSCLVTNPYTTILQNGNDTVALLSVRIFKVVNLYVIYLHCQIQICVEIQDECSYNNYTLKIGNYNFRCKPQQQNFTYHVFDT
uniref:ZP domain-containing protein n=1 Tax=Sinocyclocheilus rhinocerous TaxID=307959 RepID=A0A673MBA4_9TELE